MADVSTEEVEIGNNIATFCRYLSTKESYVWFHNLAFDGAFILDHLMRNGYEWVKEKPGPQQFTTLISFQSKFYSMEINWGRGNITELRDSLKKLPMSVGVISKTFALAESKGSIDYNKFRPRGYEPTKDELEYVTNDVLIVAKALKKQLTAGLTGLTVGADALAEYKLIIGKKNFDRFFPILATELDSEIRRAYKGGFTYADPRFSRRRLGKGRTYDVNSLYPSVMYKNILPVGYPDWDSGPPQYRKDKPLWISSITFTAKLKPDKIPCIQIKGNNMFSSTEYQEIIEEPVTVGCTNVDWDLWNDHYDIQIQEYNGTFYFEAMDGLFTQYIDKWSAVKANSTGGMRAIAKLQLNSLYGKFATNPNVTPKIPQYDDDKDLVRLVVGDPEERDPVYTAMGTFITSYARDFTIRSAQEHYSRFAYADTDSLHLVGWQPVTLEVHPSEMGKWKHEYDYMEAYFLRAKAYSERMKDGRMETHIAGLPEDAAKQVTFDHYETGHVFGGKLAPKRVPGGIVLTDINFTLSK